MKLDNFPLVLWINLNSSVDRKKYMEVLLSKNNITNIRITAIDGINLDDKTLDNICIQNKHLSRAENACTCSHLTAIKYFVEKTSVDQIIIFEDDVSFEFLDLIPYNWSDLESKIDPDFDVVQLAVTTFGPISIDLKKFNNKDKLLHYCGAAYLISRKAAISILKEYFTSSKMTCIKLDDKNLNHATSDGMILGYDNVWSIPIFTYLTDTSTIHPQHLKNHSEVKKKYLQMWLNSRK